VEIFMAEATFYFPRGFLWGTATSSHQVEGNNTNNNWWAWEQVPGHIVNGDKSGFACDWWAGRWREDFDRAANTGQNAHRLSIEWSRIQPAPDRWDENALDRYREMMRGLYERGITPLVTLHHFTEPLWVSQLDSWENEDIVRLFETYVRKVVEALREFVTLWVTLNEPNVLATFGYLLGQFPPGKHNLNTAGSAQVNMLRAHAAAYRAIHSLQPQARVGIALHVRGFVPTRPTFPLDRWAAGLQSKFFNELFPIALSTGKFRFPLFLKNLPEVKGTQDFLGINYYTRDRVAFDIRKPLEMFGRRYYPSEAELSETGYIANDPEGMFETLRWAQQFALPILITENGVEDSEDNLRPSYLTQHIHQVWRAVNFNWPVKGYFHWTLVDNFEWERGWTQRFGLWELDVDTQTRRKRPSADLYEKICRENGISTEMVAQFTPNLLGKLFPD
jgi:beta-glucosidase